MTVNPDKLYYRIGEVAALAGVKPSVLRYWETEFQVLNPSKSGTGQRLYSQNDLQLVFDIKQMLYTERLTIEGTRKKLRERKKRLKSEDDANGQPNLLLELRDDLLRIRKMLE